MKTTLPIARYVRKARSSFYYPMMLMPAERRHAMMTVYAFCRYTDDLVDGIAPVTGLQRWREAVHAAFQGQTESVLLVQLASVAKRFSIPIEWFIELTYGVEMDLHKNQYATFDELYEYCYKVASTVGLMIVRILGYDSRETEAYAVNAGIALQLTNMIRDTDQDLARERVYFPLTDFGHIGPIQNDRALLAAKQALCQRARQYHERADRCYAQTPSLSLFPARAMQNIYRELLSELERNLTPGRVIRISWYRQLAILLNTWVEERSYRDAG